MKGDISIMKELIPKDEHGIFVDAYDTARMDSLFVAGFLKNSTNMFCGILQKSLSLHLDSVKSSLKTILFRIFIRM